MPELGAHRHTRPEREEEAGHRDGDAREDADGDPAPEKRAAIVGESEQTMARRVRCPHEFREHEREGERRERCEHDGIELEHR